MWVLTLMDFIQQILRKLFYLIQFTLVLLYILLEELIWEQFAKPLFRYLKYLKLFEKFEAFLAKQNRYTILLFFLLVLVVAELLGVASAVVAVQGHIITAIIAYGLKLLLAAFAFWVLNTQKSKLLSFGWFAYLYEKTIAIKKYIQESSIYKRIIKISQRVKLYLKLRLTNFKNYILNRFWR